MNENTTHIIPTIEPLKLKDNSLQVYVAKIYFR